MNFGRHTMAWTLHVAPMSCATCRRRARRLEIDEPAMTRYHEKVFAYGAKVPDRCLEGINIPTVVHLVTAISAAPARKHEYEPGTPQRVDEKTKQ